MFHENAPLCVHVSRKSAVACPCFTNKRLWGPQMAPTSSPNLLKSTQACPTYIYIYNNNKVYIYKISRQAMLHLHAVVDTGSDPYAAVAPLKKQKGRRHKAQPSHMSIHAATGSPGRKGPTYMRMRPESKCYLLRSSHKHGK
jgi:hypothetical protein